MFTFLVGIHGLNKSDKYLFILLSLPINAGVSLCVHSTESHSQSWFIRQWACMKHVFNISILHQHFRHGFKINLSCTPKKAKCEKISVTSPKVRQQKFCFAILCFRCSYCRNLRGWSVMHVSAVSAPSGSMFGSVVQQPLPPQSQLH